MSSVNTNKGAMIALETLRGINKDLSSVQSQISTGKKISSSTDNAAIWSIATVMESDVKSFGQVTDSLNLGAATVGVARAASEQVTGLLQEAKSLIVGANDPSVSDADRSKYQTDLNELTGTISSIVDAASFNGQNLLKGTGDVDILASLNRDASGTVTRGDISVNRIDLSADAEVAGSSISTGTGTFADVSGTTIADGSGNITIDIEAGTAGSDTRYQLSFDSGGESVDVDYVAQEGLTQDEIAAGLKSAIETAVAATSGATPPTDDFSGLTVSAVTDNAGDARITLTNTRADVGGNDITVTDGGTNTGYTAAGAMNGLAALDISTADGAATALTEIDNILQSAIDATAEFGSKGKRIDNQNEFITVLSDSLKTGVGALTDANLEEASARLQSLQVQQQLGVQALSIANQSPQSLLSLFR